MKRFCALLIFVLALLTFKLYFQGLPALSPYRDSEGIDGIWIEAEKESISPTGLKIVFYNTTQREDLFRGLEYCIEKKDHNRWYSIPLLPDVSFGAPSVDLPIPPASQIESGFLPERDYDPDSNVPWKRYPPNEMYCNWEDTYGELPPGEYRVIIEILSKDHTPIPESSPGVYLSAYFTITNYNQTTG